MPAWRGTKGLNYYLIGESNHLTPDALEDLGVKLLDPGYFGRAIYMTQFPSYGFQYATEDKLLLSWTLMGRVYPVVESVHSSNSFIGKPLLDGFDSHYVLTKRAGNHPPLHFQRSCLISTPTQDSFF